MRREFIDYDYTQELKQQDSEALEWLAKFNAEYYGAAIKKNDAGRVAKGHLHRTNAQAKEIFDDNNRRNNDVLGVSRVNIGLTEINGQLSANDGWYITNCQLTEDATIANIETKDNEEYMSYEEYLENRGNMTMEMLMIYESIYGDYDEKK